MAILSGTACSVLSKLMMGLHGTGLSGELEVFRKPIFQTFATFLGMSFGLVLHILVIQFRLPFPGYEKRLSSDEIGIRNHRNNIDGEELDTNDIEGKLGSALFSAAPTTYSVTSMIKAKYFRSGQFITATTGNDDYKNNYYGSMPILVSGNTVDETRIRATEISADNNSIENSPLTTGNHQLPLSLSQNYDQNQYYFRDQSATMTAETNNIKRRNKNNKIPLWMYLFLAIPSVFDLIATALCMIGLQYVDVSIYQLLRCSGIFFVAWMKQHILRDHLYWFQWIGVLWNVVGVVLVGTTALLDGHTKLISSTLELEGAVATTVDRDDGNQQALYGVGLILSGAVVQAMQFVFEEKVMKMEIPTPPLLLIGMEGFWGSILCLLVVYPLAYAIPGDDNVGSAGSYMDTDKQGNHSTGSYENPVNTYAMFTSSPHIQIAFAIYLLAIFGFNFFAIMVTYMLDSVWHAILDNFRPISVWLVELFIYYVFFSVFNTPASPLSQKYFGEYWTPWSWIQVCASVVLLYGTAIYNAPNAGSIKLKGNWYSFGFDFTNEYREIEEQRTQMLSSLVRTTKFEFVPLLLADQEKLEYS